MKKSLALIIFLFSYQASAIPWIEDAFMKNQIVVRLGYEALFQPAHLGRILSSVHTILIDFERHWESVRLFVTDIGYHWGVGDSVANQDFADDLRFGAQWQFQEFEVLFGAVRFWTKLPNTRDETFLGTDETDFTIVLIESWKISQRAALHINFGLAIVGAPELMQSQNDFAVGGIRFDWQPAPWLSLQAMIHGISGFKKNDDKLSAKIIGGYHVDNFALLLELQAPFSTNYIDYADPLDHTAWGGRLSGQLTF